MHCHILLDIQYVLCLYLDGWDDWSLGLSVDRGITCSLFLYHVWTLYAFLQSDAILLYLAITGPYTDDITGDIYFGGLYVNLPLLVPYRSDFAPLQRACLRCIYAGADFLRSPVVGCLNTFYGFYKHLVFLVGTLFACYDCIRFWCRFLFSLTADTTCNRSTLRSSTDSPL